MSAAIEIRVHLPLDRFPLSVQWETDETSLGLFGASGAGKTTLLEAVAGLRTGAVGRIRIRDRVWLDTERRIRLRPEDRGVGYVPQDLLLFPHRTVRENLLSGHRRATRAGPNRLAPERVIEVLELRDLERRRIDSLSGGEKRRVALGRALCSGPDLLVLDEPLAGLDAPLRDRVITYLLRAREEFGIPTLFVSHDVTETKLLSREVAILSSGRVALQGPPDAVFLHPDAAPEWLADGFENVLAGSVVGLEESAAHVEIEPGVALVVPGRGLAQGSRVRIGLRAEDLILAVRPPSGLSAQNELRGVVREIRQTTGPLLVIVEIGRGRVSVAASITHRARRALCLAEGMEVFLVGKAHACRVWIVHDGSPSHRPSDR